MFKCDKKKCDLNLNVQLKLPFYRLHRTWFDILGSMPRGSVTLIICNNYTFKDGGLLTPSKVHLICLHVTVTSPCFYIFNLEKCFGSANILVYFRLLWMVKWNLCLTHFSFSLSSSSEAHHLRAVTFVKLFPLSCRSAVVQLSARCHPLKPPQLQHCLTRSHFAASHLQLSSPSPSAVSHSSAWLISLRGSILGAANILVKKLSRSVPPDVSVMGNINTRASLTSCLFRLV